MLTIVLKTHVKKKNLKPKK